MIYAWCAGAVAGDVARAVAGSVAGAVAGVWRGCGWRLPITTFCWFLMVWWYNGYWMGCLHLLGTGFFYFSILLEFFAFFDFLKGFHTYHVYTMYSID